MGTVVHQRVTVVGPGRFRTRRPRTLRGRTWRALCHGGRRRNRARFRRGGGTANTEHRGLRRPRCAQGGLAGPVGLREEDFVRDGDTESPEGCSAGAAQSPRPCSGGGGEDPGTGRGGDPSASGGCSAPSEGAFLFSHLNLSPQCSFSRTVPAAATTDQDQNWHTEIAVRWITISRHRPQLAETYPLGTLGAWCAQEVTVLPSNHPSGDSSALKSPVCPIPALPRAPPRLIWPPSHFSQGEK